MKSVKEQIALGVIVLLVGLFIFLGQPIGLDFGNVSLIAAGLAFVLLFRTKRKSWSLVLGGYLIYFGLSSVIMENSTQGLLTEDIFTFAASSLLFFVTGVIMLTLFYVKNKRGLLVPGALLIALSVNNFFSTVLLFSNGCVFYFVLAVCAFFIYKYGWYFLGRWPKYIGFLFTGIGILRLIFEAS